MALNEIEFEASHAPIPRPSLPNHLLTIFLAIFSGLSFLGMLHWALSHVPADWYVSRDDGIITLSAARNFVDYGFIGVNPSGPIVSASSSPLQLFLYAGLLPLMRFFHIGPFGYGAIQTNVCALVTGALVFWILRRRPLLGFGSALATEIALCFIPPFYEWFASGMENPLTTVGLLATVVVLYEQYRSGKIHFWTCIPISLTSIARFEAIYNVAPLLILFCLFWYKRYQTASALKLSALTFVIWAAFLIWHFAYFGSLAPNTSIAEGINFPEPDISDWTLHLSKKAFMGLGVFIAIIPLILLTFSDKQPSLKLLYTLCSCIVLLALTHVFVFGPARIDDYRVISYAPLFVFIAIGCALEFSNDLRKSILSTFVIGVICAIIADTWIPKPYYLGWTTIGFEKVRKEFLRLASENDIRRATIANPDLGIMTYFKNFDDVDLGMIGSPIIARMKKGRPLTIYVTDFVQPDFIEVHGWWTAQFCGSLLSDAKFLSLYQQVGTSYSIPEICALPPPAMPMIIFEKKSIVKNARTPERTFLDALQKSLDVETIRRESQNCHGGQYPHETDACRYVARTVYRFIPELRHGGKFEEVVSLFRDQADRALLNGWRDSQSYKTIIGVIEDEVANSRPMRQPPF
jgi:hypothetical protein